MSWILRGVATVLGAALLTWLAFVAFTPEDWYDLQTADKQAEGRLFPSSRKLRVVFWINRLAAGPITDAYMTTRNPPGTDTLSLMPFLAPGSPKLQHFYQDNIRLSGQQVQHILNGNWMLVVRSARLTADSFAGRLSSCRLAHEGLRICAVEWSPSQGNDETPGSPTSKEILEGKIWFIPSANKICFTDDHSVFGRRVSSIGFAAPGEKIVAAPRVAEVPLEMVGRLDDPRQDTAAGNPATFCSPDTETLSAAFLATTLCVRATVEAPPATDYMSPVTLGFHDTRIGLGPDTGGLLMFFAFFMVELTIGIWVFDRGGRRRASLGARLAGSLGAVAVIPACIALLVYMALISGGFGPYGR